MQIAAIAVLVILLSAVRAIPLDQATALQNFFAATGGSKWTRNSGWLSGDFSDPCAFEGIKCTSIKKDVVVTSLVLNGNNLVGYIPSDFFLTMINLEVIEMYQNPGLTGSIPNFPAGSTLQSLLLYGCAFTGVIPDSIFTPSVTVIHLLQNQLTGGLPDSISRCVSLNTLIVGQNSLNIGTLSNSICSCTAIQQIDLTASGVTGLPSCFTSLGGLKNLNFQDNTNLDVSMENVLCLFTNLEDLYLPQTGVSGTIPTCVSNWGGMKNLIIENTQMSGSIPTEIFSLRNLVSLHIALSDFSGIIPDSFESLPYLTDVFFAGKKGSTGFIDPIPKTLFQLRSITSLTLQFNSFTGPLPDLSNMYNLAALDFSNNLQLSTNFPEELFTKVWIIPPTSGDVLRSLHFDFTPVYGTIPSTTTVFSNMNQQNGFSFTHSLLTGYIPNSTLGWVHNPSSLTNLVQSCFRMLTPVMPWVEPLFGNQNFHGLQIDISAISSTIQVFSMAGGEQFTLSVSDQLVNFPLNVLACGFCIAADQTNCMSDSLSDLDPQTLSTIVVVSKATITGKGELSCVTPTGITSANPGLGLYYKGPGYGPSYLSEIFLLSSVFYPFRFYNPTPSLSYLMPNRGRLEGCSQITAVGQGFTNAPNASLLIDNNIYAFGSVINDTAATFLIPLASGGNASGHFDYPTSLPLRVVFLATGSPDHQGSTSATYQFDQTCRTPLVPCINGFQDPEGCPTPLCRCNSAGTCNFNSSTQVYMCGCTSGFDGLGCEACGVDYFGTSCDKCPCDLSHSTCNWGIDKDGSCSCNSYFIGADCTVSIVELGVFIPLGLIAVGAGVLLLRRKRVSSLDEELFVNQS